MVAKNLPWSRAGLNPTRLGGHLREAIAGGLRDRPHASDHLAVAHPCGPDGAEDSLQLRRRPVRREDHGAGPELRGRVLRADHDLEIAVRYQLPQELGEILRLLEDLQHLLQARGFRKLRLAQQVADAVVDNEAVTGVVEAPKALRESLQE